MEIERNLYNLKHRYVLHFVWQKNLN